MVAINSPNDSLHNNNGANEALRFLCRHLVALCITYQQVDDKKAPFGEVLFFACPGIIICIRGICHFLTAGHILQDWKNNLSQERVILHSAVLADTFGPDITTQQPIPFDFKNEPIFFIYDEKEGLDFGLISLRSYYVRLLAKNGTIAIFEENWIHQHRVELHGYAMLGLPDEFIDSIHNSHSGDSQFWGIVSPTLIVLQKLEEPPKDILRPKNPYFIGKLHPDLPLASIVGMSGGPIFGFNYGPPMRYWIVAIQSSWIKSRGITFGCSLPVLAELIGSWTDQLSKEEDFFNK
jgi:hypothetical protein